MTVIQYNLKKILIETFGDKFKIGSSLKMPHLHPF